MEEQDVYFAPFLSNVLAFTSYAEMYLLIFKSVNSAAHKCRNVFTKEVQEKLIVKLILYDDQASRDCVKRYIKLVRGEIVSAYLRDR